LVAVATSLERSRNEYQIEHLHQDFYTSSENLVKIGLIGSEISLPQRAVKEEKEDEEERK